MKDTNLPSALVKTISSLRLTALIGKESANQKALIKETNRLRPGFWLVEISSITERRKEYGCFSSIVRLICFYQLCPGAEVEYY